MRPIVSHEDDMNTHRDVADIFALRIARKRYGRTGRVGALNVTGWNRDGMEVSAFIGYPDPIPGASRSATIGGNVTFFVWIDREGAR